MRKLKLNLLSDEYAVWRLDPDAPAPSFDDSTFWSVTRTPEELSIVSKAQSVPPDVSSEPGWRCIAVRGPLAFELTGVLSSMTEPLARAGVSVFAVSTFNTDYLLVKADQLDLARVTLEAAGHEFVDPSSTAKE